MEDVFRAGEDRRVGLELPDILPIAGEIGFALEVIEVAAVAADQIVDDADRKAASSSASTMWLPMRPGAAGDDRSGLAAHAALSLFSRRTL